MKAIFEPIPNSKDQSFHFGIFENKEFKTPWHYHPEWELTFITESTGIRSVGNSIQTYSPGELVLLGPNLPHCWKSNTVKKQLAKSTFIQFDQNLFGKGWMEKDEFLPIKKLLKASENGLLFDNEISIIVGEKMLHMKNTIPILRMIEILKILHKLSLEKYEILSLGTQFNTNLMLSERVEKIVKFVEDNYQHKIDSSQLGELIFMTPVSFSKFFKKTFDKTFTSYLNEYRISKACEYLKETELSVEQIAFEAGYQNLSFFHRQFKLFTKKTPANYRQEFYS